MNPGMLLSYLVVEDSEMLRSHIKRRIFETGGVDIETAANGREALEIIQRRVALRRPIDVIVTDLEMPEMNGRDFLRAATHLMDFNKVAVLVVTHINSEDEVKEVIGLRVDQYILKPFVAERFEVRLKQAICKKFSFSRI
jgi:two-component system chemotaxis response regulator CheY